MDLPATHALQQQTSLSTALMESSRKWQAETCSSKRLHPNEFSTSELYYATESLTDSLPFPIIEWPFLPDEDSKYFAASISSPRAYVIADDDEDDHGKVTYNPKRPRRLARVKTVDLRLSLIGERIPCFRPKQASISTCAKTGLSMSLSDSKLGTNERSN
jgi:hypothetical protein